MRLSWYDSAIDTVTMDIPSLERPHSGHIKKFYNATDINQTVGYLVF